MNAPPANIDKHTHSKADKMAGASAKARRAYVERTTPESNGIEKRKDCRLTPADIHLAEYSVLANRITYYVTLQYGTWAVAAALFGYIAPLWLKYSNHRNLEWIALVSILAVNWAVLHINYEFLLIVVYLENVLHKPLAIEVGAKPDAVLGFEGFIRKRGGLENFHRNIAPIIVFGIGTVVLFALLLIDIFCTGWSYSDIWWAIASVPILIIVCIKIWQISVLNRELKN